MEIQFQCDLADYREALDFRLKRTVGYYLLLALGTVSVLVGTFVAYKVDFGGGLIMQLVGIIWLAWPVLIRPLWLDRSSRRPFHHHHREQFPLQNLGQRSRLLGQIAQRFGVPIYEVEAEIAKSGFPIRAADVLVSFDMRAFV